MSPPKRRAPGTPAPARRRQRRRPGLAVGPRVPVARAGGSRSAPDHDGRLGRQGQLMGALVSVLAAAVAAGPPTTVAGLPGVSVSPNSSLPGTATLVQL